MTTVVGESKALCAHARTKARLAGGMHIEPREARGELVCDDCGEIVGSLTCGHSTILVEVSCATCGKRFVDEEAQVVREEDD